MARKRKADPIIEPTLIIEPELKAAEEIAAADAIQASAEPRASEPMSVEPSEPESEAIPEAEAVAESLETPAAEDPEEVEDQEEEFEPAPQPPAKLERLQKILAQAGVASRRHAEELITGGQVEINGQVVTTLGTKADAGRDHIRVNGKLLKGRGAAALFHAEQAARLRHHSQRSRGPAHGDAVFREDT